MTPASRSASAQRSCLLPHAPERLRRVIFPWMRHRATVCRDALQLGVPQDRGWTPARREAAVGALAELFAWYARRSALHLAPSNDDATPATPPHHSRRS